MEDQRERQRARAREPVVCHHMPVMHREQGTHAGETRRH